MVGCNCASVETSDPDCCIVRSELPECVIPEAKAFYCGYCDDNGHILACQLWLDCCVAHRVATSLSTIRFKTQNGRDAAFGILIFPNGFQFGKYTRFPKSPSVSLNTPSIFDTLCAIASASAYRDRLGEKTHFRRRKVHDKKTDEDVFTHSNWSFNDASTAFHKNVTLLKSQIRRHCVSRRDFENNHKLKWVNAGTPVLVAGDKPYLGQLSVALKQSCLNPWIDGAFAIVDEKPADISPSGFKYKESWIMFPINDWSTPIECEGDVLLFRPDGKASFVHYKYDCHQFTFTDLGISFVTEDRSWSTFVDSATQFLKSKTGSDTDCLAWLETVIREEKYKEERRKKEKEKKEKKEKDKKKEEEKRVDPPSETLG